MKNTFTSAIALILLITFNIDASAFELNQNLVSTCHSVDPQQELASIKIFTNNTFFWQDINLNDTGNYKVRVVPFGLDGRILGQYNKVIQGAKEPRVICSAGNCPDTILNYIFSDVNNQNDRLILTYNRTAQSAVLELPLGEKILYPNCQVTKSNQNL